MGEGGKGWAEARREIVRNNIQGYDIVFMQEVQWQEKRTKKDIARPAGYEVVLASSAHENRNTCILYNAERLQCKDKKTKDKITKPLTADQRWTAYSNRLCVQVFSLKGKEDSSQFVAISLHAPSKSKADNDSFCDLMKTAIEEIVEDQELPVLVGGDFNTNIRWWEKDGFEGLDYVPGRAPIDFITMKVPRINNHLKMGKVQKMKGENIVIPVADDDESIEVKLKDGTETTAEDLKDKAVDDFFRHLCGCHMPLTVDIVYSDIAIPTEGAHDEDEVEDSKKQSDMLERKVKKLEKEKDELKKKMEEMKEQHQAELSKLKVHMMRTRKRHRSRT